MRTRVLKKSQSTPFDFTAIFSIEQMSSYPRLLYFFKNIEFSRTEKIALVVLLLLLLCFGSASAEESISDGSRPKQSGQPLRVVPISQHIDRTVRNSLKTILPAISARFWSQLQLVKRELRNDMRRMTHLLEQVAGIAQAQPVGDLHKDINRRTGGGHLQTSGLEVPPETDETSNEKINLREEDMRATEQWTSVAFERNLTETVAKLEKLLTEGLVTLTEGCVREVEENNQAVIDRQRDILRSLERLHARVDRLDGRSPTAVLPSLPFLPSSQVLDPPRECREAQQRRAAGTDGVTLISPKRPLEDKPRRVRCDQTTSGGGWTVMLHRQQQEQQLNFRRDWREYEEGFGDPSGEYWIGLKTLHELTRSNPFELLVVMAIGDEKASSFYSNFSVGSSSSPGRGYRLRVSDYHHNSTGGDALSYHSGMPFTTYDADNDIAKGSCSLWCGGGGWWYNYCFYANPTGVYPPPSLTRTTEGDAYLEWRTWQGYYAYLTQLTMMIRPKTH
ncbi:fibrinogen C domain-containing protein 1-A-like isoform X2 [Hyalella azteca]|uniref:Fibrinogen C domain-containing protein 1-A-like isoform X2 n=1 Tax=Hyalella azteca TaxID=294128 RepID=A0A8B7PPL2_HYAAZ|nr:fibrinogen C domain-containing protein 1-A-like isoform X2 [Hyalella azteca]